MCIHSAWRIRETAGRKPAPCRTPQAASANCCSLHRSPRLLASQVTWGSLPQEVRGLMLHARYLGARARLMRRPGVCSPELRGGPEPASAASSETSAASLLAMPRSPAWPAHAVGWITTTPPASIVVQSVVELPAALASASIATRPGMTSSPPLIGIRDLHSIDRAAQGGFHRAGTGDPVVAVFGAALSAGYSACRRKRSSSSKTSPPPRVSGLPRGGAWSAAAASRLRALAGILCSSTSRRAAVSLRPTPAL